MKQGGLDALRKRRQMRDEEYDEQQQQEQRRLRSKLSTPPIDINAIMKLAAKNPTVAMELLESTMLAIEESTDMEELQQRVGGTVMGWYLQDVPYEVLSKIAMNLPVPSVVALCRTNQGFAELCSSEWFWKQRAKQDYGITFAKYPTWKESYKWLTMQPPSANVIRVVFSSSKVKPKLMRCTVSSIAIDDCESVILLTGEFERNVERIDFHGSDGYPVVAYQTNDDPYDYTTHDKGLIFSIVHELSKPLIYIFLSGSRVVDAVVNLYGQDNIDNFIAQNNDCFDNGFFLIPRPMEFEPGISAEAERKIATDLMQGILVDSVKMA